MSAMNCCGEHAGAVSDPVFVLCTGRSGSTLLRFLLDSHPDLACPPEFRLPMVVAQLTSLCLSFEQYPLPTERGNGTAALSAVAVARIRETVDQTIGPYLARRGKKRYCDKNLGTEQFADTLASVYPDAKFICLYRHPMDMVASGIEACPWGLANYSFEPYVAANPGNSVLALARYWADHTAAILTVEEKFPSRCHRVRYEDLVADPDGVMTQVFEFLGLPPVPEISRACFSPERERFGPGDFKIWNTSQVETDSAGRGWLVPVSMIPSPVKTSVNEIAEKLGYAQIDSAWGTAQRPAQGGQSGPMSSVTGRIESRVQAGLRRLDAQFADAWRPHSAESFVLVAMATGGPGDDVWWRVDLAGRTAVSGTGCCDAEAGWNVTAPAKAWEEVIDRGTNLAIAFRRLGMRYRDAGDGGEGSFSADLRVAMMSDLLGINSWRPEPVTPAPSASRHPERLGSVN